VLAGIRLPTERVPALCLVAGPGSLVGPISHLAGIPVSGGLPDDLFLSIPACRLAVCLRCLGRRRRDRPEAACLPGSRAAVGLAGGFSAVQKLLTTTTAATAFRGAGDGNRTRTVSLGRVLIPPCFRVLQRYWRPQLASGDPCRPGLVARVWPGSLASRGENRAPAEVVWPRITATSRVSHYRGCETGTLSV
jgi:hypothetical protein